ncbi:MAG: ABC transporter ATP-binding protein [Bacteroidales bacterium]|nr:ABC transporter ATP-binding protein [Bacteroidales bacterium]
MKVFFKQVFGYIIPYKVQAILSILFNFIFIIFNLFSVTMMIPFLGILFKTKSLVTELPEFSLSVDYFLDFMYFYLSKIILVYGESLALLFLCVLIIILTLIKTASRYFSLFYLAPVRTGIVKDIRNKLYGKVVNLPISYYSDERKGDIISRITADVQEIEVSIVSTLETLIKDPIMILFYIIVLFTTNFKLTLFVLVLLPVSGYIIGRIGKNLRKTSLRGQRKLGFILSIIEETISGLRIIKAFNNEERITKNFENTNNLYSKILVKISRRRALASPLSEFLGTIVMIAILFYGSNLVLSQSSNLTAEILIFFLLVFYLIINPAKSFSTAVYNVQKGMASVDRINKVLKAEITIKDKPSSVSFNEFKYSIVYKNVYFKYEEDIVLKNINLTIEKGKTIALVGQSGAGKSTLADLLPRLIDVDEGDILIDDISIKDIKLKDLRNLMGIVTQQSILFNDTVFNNIAFGYNGATEKHVIEAAKVANAHEFIVQMPNEYYSNIGDSGSKLSGGQRQRLSIARAVLKNPPILILDEATSALDTESERLVQDALYRLMENRTSIVIAHRLSTVKNADEIIVLHEGEIVERGKHSELLKKKGIYKKLYDLQMFA